LPSHSFVLIFGYHFFKYILKNLGVLMKITGLFKIKKSKPTPETSVIKISEQISALFILSSL